MELVYLVFAPFYVFAVIATGYVVIYFIDACRKQVEK